MESGSARGDTKAGKFLFLKVQKMPSSGPTPTTPAPAQQESCTPLHKPQPWQEHGASLGLAAPALEFSSLRQGLTGACVAQHGTVHVMHIRKTETLYFNSSARTVIMCLSHRAENFFRGWELSDSYCLCSGSADEHLFRTTLSLQDKVAGKVPGSYHPYACSELCLLLSEYLTCL